MTRRWNVAIAGLGAAVALTGCTAEVEDTAPPAPLIVMGDEQAVWDATMSGPVTADQVQQEWRGVVDSWPLPVPEGAFPDELPLDNLRLADLQGNYESGQGLMHANFTWMYAAPEAYLAAYDSGDADAAAYWLEAMRLFSLSSIQTFNNGSPEAYCTSFVAPLLDGRVDALRATIDRVPGPSGLPTYTMADCESPG